MKYNHKSIIRMSDVEHIRKRPGMLLGDTSNPIRLLEEILDNAMDEVQAGVCKNLKIEINTKNNTFSISDDGRGFPFNQKLPLQDDPPVLSSCKLLTSGKFNKDKDSSAYRVSSGLHGVGLVPCYALSKKMEIEIYRDNLHAHYIFKDKDISRSQEKHKNKNIPFSTKVTIFPDSKYFETLEMDTDSIVERLKICSIHYPELKIYFIVDDKTVEIKEKKDEFISEYVSDMESPWICFFNEKNGEECEVMVGWDDESPISPTIYSIINLVKVNEGHHINTITNMIKSSITKLAKKYKYEFQPDDCFNSMRLYISMKIVNTSFEGQVKVKLDKKSNISICDFFEEELLEYLINDEEYLKSILEKFQLYRKNLQNKKLINKKGKSRGFSNFVKLKDCTEENGELFICEGNSAAGSLVRSRNVKKHAILPLRGVIPNCLKKKKDLFKNTEIKEIVQTVGCGITPNCKIENLRYSKICICCDADPAGHFISSLLIMLFVTLMPEVIKNGKLYLCDTPLFIKYKNKKVIPLWNNEDREKAKQDKENIRRIKGLGEFSPEEIKEFTFNRKTRNLIKIEWDNNTEKIYGLMTDSNIKRDLVLGNWTKG